jgi:hypothetical protein
MNDAVAVRAIEGIGDLGRIAQDFIARQRSTRESRGQRFAFEELHDEEGEAILFAKVVEDADMRMVQRPDDAGFAIEALAELRVGGEFGGQDLDGDLPVESSIDGPVDVAHASGGDGGDYFVGTQPGAGSEGREHDAANYSRALGPRGAVTSFTRGNGLRPRRALASGLRPEPTRRVYCRQARPARQDHGADA